MKLRFKLHYCIHSWKNFLIYVPKAVEYLLQLMYKISVGLKVTLRTLIKKLHSSEQGEEYFTNPSNWGNRDNEDSQWIFTERQLKTHYMRISVGAKL